MSYSWKPQPLDEQPWEVQAATLREQLRHAESRARYFERRHAEADAQLEMYKAREKADK